MQLRGGTITGGDLDVQINRDLLVEYFVNTSESWSRSHGLYFDFSAPVMLGMNGLPSFGAPLSVNNLRQFGATLSTPPSVRNEYIELDHQTYAKTGIKTSGKLNVGGKTTELKPELKNEDKVKVFDSSIINVIGENLTAASQLKEEIEKFELNIENSLNEQNIELEVQNEEISEIFDENGEIKDLNKFFGAIKQDFSESSDITTEEYIYSTLSEKDKIVREILLKLSDWVEAGKEALYSKISKEDFEFYKMMISYGLRAIDVAGKVATAEIIKKTAGQDVADDYCEKVKSFESDMGEAYEGAMAEANKFIAYTQRRYAQSPEEYKKIREGLQGVFAIISIGCAATLRLKPTVKKAGRRYPRNAQYAGKMYDMSKLPKEMQIKYPHGVPFTAAGYPDFSRYSIRKVQINVTGKNGVDQLAADKAAGFTGGNKRPAGYTWHHCEDCKTMILIPTDLNNAVKHTGGAAIIRALDNFK